MPFRTPQLDDLTFQQIVDHAKRLIPRYCPEWTDHNVSDPGVTLIELFASMTEMLLYRVNQVPDKVYLTFLNFVGVRLTQPEAARGYITFYLSKGLGLETSTSIEILKGVEVATARTETHEPLIFTTRADLTIRPARLLALRRGDTQLPEDQWSTVNVTGGVGPSQPVDLFTALTPGEALYLDFDADLSRHVIEIECNCVYGHGTGYNPKNPPFIWESRCGAHDSWRECLVELDETQGFNREGRWLVHLPDTSVAPPDTQPTHVLRCRLTEAQSDVRWGYTRSPQITSFVVRALGATVAVEQEIVVGREELGVSDGTPGQRFRLRQAGVLRRRDDEYLEVEADDGNKPDRYMEVAHFSPGDPDAAVYTLDDDGTLLLGPLVRKPDGTSERLGRIPPRGRRLWFTRYRHGGGASGNVPPHTITVLKSSRDDIRRVTNHEPTVGGRNRQTLDDLRHELPTLLNLRARAVTADDFEYHAARAEGVARARCLAPGRKTGSESEAPGVITVLVVPELARGEYGQLLPRERLKATDGLIQRVQQDLEARAPLGCLIKVQAPSYLRVSVQADIWPERYEGEAALAALKRQAVTLLNRLINPVTGYDGSGWPFDRSLRDWEVANYLRALPGVAGVKVSLFLVDADDKPLQSPVPEVQLARDQLICSAPHDIQIISPPTAAQATPSP